MNLVPNLASEFEEICVEYTKHDQEGADIITLVKLFDEYVGDEEYAVTWKRFLSKHAHQVTAPMVGQIMYLLVTYWAHGHELFEGFPPLEKILLRDTVQEISDEVHRRSEANGDLVIPG